MHRTFIAIASLLIISSASIAQQLSVESLVREAFVSNALSDRYKAYRIIAFLREKRPDAFVSVGAQEHLEAFFRIATLQQFEAECEKLSKTKDVKAKDKILYTCGKLLIDGFSLQKAKSILEQVTPRSDWFVQSQILLSSMQLGDGDGELCLKTLSPKLLKRIRNQNSKDLYFLTRARCLIEVNRLPDAIVQYQQISAGSSFYYDALEETAWAQFKIRHLESSRTLLDVMITTHETGIKEGGGVSPAAYFRSRYLQAYIELVEKNSEKAEQQFRALRDSVTKYAQENLVDEGKAQKMARRIVEENAKWLDTKAMPKDIIKFLTLIRGWGDSRMRKRLDRLIDFQFSVTREIERLAKFPSAEFEPYQKNLQRLSAQNASDLSAEFSKASRSVERALRVMRIKSELGRIEITWAERAQGVRGIGELLESYQSEIREVEDFF